MSEDPKVRYVPGAHNRYDYEHDVIILDERLKDYPKAHNSILNHELEHANGAVENFREFVKLEFRTDLQHFFGTDEESDAVREYYEDIGPKRPMGSVISAKVWTGNLFRMVWNLTLAPFSWLFRAGHRLSN